MTCEKIFEYDLDIVSVIEYSASMEVVLAAAAYAWVNARPAWGAGYANLATGKIHIDAYLH